MQIDKFQSQRNEIMQAAAQLFAEHGFHKASMSQLAKTCQVSKPLLYHYYQDKETILFNTLNNYIYKLNKIILEVDKLKPKERLYQLIERFFQAYSESKYHHRVLIQDVKYLNADSQAIIMDQQRFVVNAFASAIVYQFPELKKTNLIKPLTMSLFGMMNWTFTWFRPEGKLTYEDMAPIVNRLFVGGTKAIIDDKEFKFN